MIISTSNNKNIKEIIKKGIEKDEPLIEKGWKPHSKGELFKVSHPPKKKDKPKTNNKKTKTIIKTNKNIKKNKTFKYPINWKLIILYILKSFILNSPSIKN